MTYFTETVGNDWITEEELAELLMIDVRRIRDRRSHHINGKEEFISHIKPTSKCVLYRIDDVMNWLDNQPVCSFGSNISGLDNSVSD